MQPKTNIDTENSCNQREPTAGRLHHEDTVESSQRKPRITKRPQHNRIGCLQCTVTIHYSSVSRLASPYDNYNRKSKYFVASNAKKMSKILPFVRLHLPRSLGRPKGDNILISPVSSTWQYTSSTAGTYARACEKQHQSPLWWLQLLLTVRPVS